MGYKYSKYLIYSLVAVLGLIISSCQSSIRFSSDVNNKVKSVSSNSNTGKYNNQNKSEILDNPFIQKAESWIGVPYNYGGDSRNGVDCSAFVQLIYADFGIYLPRTSAEQYIYAKKIDFNDKDIGDLIFFQNKGRINHVGIYIGDEKMIHSSSSKGVIKQSISDPYFKNKYAGIGRVK